MSCGHSLNISASQLMISYFILSLHMLIPWLINVVINYITSTLVIVGSGNIIGRLLINVMGLSELTVAGNISSVLFFFPLSLLQGDKSIPAVVVRVPRLSAGQRCSPAPRAYVQSEWGLRNVSQAPAAGLL